MATSLVQLKKKLIKSPNPDFLFLEPSEMIVTKEIRNVVKMGLRDLSYEIGPLITLVDGPSFDFQWQERPKLLLGQIQGADQVAISRADMIERQQIKHIRRKIDVEDDNLLLLSMQNNAGIDELVETIILTNQEV